MNNPDLGQQMLAESIRLAVKCAALPYDQGHVQNDSNYIKTIVSLLVGRVHRNELECLQEIVGEALCLIEDGPGESRAELGWVPQVKSSKPSEEINEMINSIVYRAIDEGKLYRNFCDFTELDPDGAEEAFQDFMASPNSLPVWWANNQGNYV